MIAIFILGCRVLWESASQLALSLSAPRNDPVNPLFFRSRLTRRLTTPVDSVWERNAL